VTGGLIGGAAGGVLGGTGKLVSNALKSTKSSIKSTKSSIKRPTPTGGIDDSYLARTSRRIEDSMKKRAELKTQPVAVQKAAKVDISPETSHFIISMSKQDKTLARTMLSRAKAGKDTLKPTSRPMEVPGKVILQPVNFIERARTQAGKNLGEVVKAMPNKPFRPATAGQVLQEGLDQLGIRIGRGNKLNFADSSITNATEQGILQSIVKDLSRGSLTPLKSHRMRQRIWGMLKTARTKGELTYAQTVAEKVRGALKDDMVAATGRQGQTYAAEAAKYAQAEDILKDFFGLIGKKWEDKADDVLSLRAGEVGSRILSNASAAPLDVIGRLEIAAKNLGYKSTNNPVDLLIFNDLLEDLVGTTQTRTLRGQVARGVRDGGENLAGMAEDALTGNRIGVVKKAVDFVRGITPEEQMRMLEELLR